jgi:hypothetical protein
MLRTSRFISVALAFAAALAVLPPTAIAQSGVQLDGFNDHVTFGAAAPLNTPTFTLEVWFMRTGAGVATSTGTGGISSAIPLLTKGRGEAEGANKDMNYFFGIRTSDNVLCADYEEDTLQTTIGLNHPVFGKTPIRNNVWYHAAATFNGTTWRLYLNGVLDSALVVGPSRLPESQSLQHAALGTAMTSTGISAGFFAGKLDEARVWGHARPGDGIRDSMLTEIPSAPGLLGRWGFNEGIGDSAFNSVAGSPTGALKNGAVWATGSPFALSNALSFAGTTGYVTFGDSAALDLPQFTLETWFRRDGAGVTTTTGTGGVTNAIPLLTKGRGEAEGSVVDMNYFLGIRASDNVLCADFEEGATGSSPGLNHPVLGVTPITPGAWHHAAATYDGVMWSLYLDGNLEDTVTVNQPPQSLSVQPAGLATGLNSMGIAAGFFHGVLDEARIWSVARTQGEIQATINTQITAAQPNLVARWGLNEGAGTGVFGSAGTSVHGTIGGPRTAWAWADSAPFNLAVGPPNAPSGLSVQATSHASVHVTWADNSTNEAGFELQRSTDGGSTWASALLLVAGTTSHDESGLDPLTEYCYRVRSVGPSGQSLYEGPQCATLPAETNNGLDLGGSNAYVAFGRAPGLGAGVFTLECWFRRDGDGVGTSTGAGGVPDGIPLVTKGRAQTDGGVVDMNYFFGIRASDSVLVADFEEGAGGDSVGLNHPIAGVTRIDTGVWHHGAATYDGATWRLYLDGCLEAEHTVGQPPQSQSYQHAALGSALDSSGVASGFFDGALDEARIWSVARTQAEIQATLNSAITVAQAGLIGRWSLNETGGAIVYASAGTGPDGTLAGSAWTRDAGAPFDIDFTHTIAATAGPGGTIAPDGDVDVACNGQQSFAITPDAGYSIDSLVVDGGPVAVAGGYTFTDVTSDHTIEVTFADVTPPTATVMSPNGGESLIIGSNVSLDWDADDGAGVTGVDLLLSRSGSAGPYETIATGVPNTGSFTWTVTGPPVLDNAFLRVIAHDVGSNTATDESDSAFTIADPPTGTLLALFDAALAGDGIRVRWQLGDALQGAAVALERADAAQGPWSRLRLEPEAHGPALVVIDRDVVAARTYFYRLQIRSAEGAILSFGPLSATMGEPIREFALAPVAPNPARDVARFEFALPRESRVHLAILDVQGREVAVLVDGVYPAGRFQATWNGSNGTARAPAGVYYARCQMGEKTLRRRLVLVR